MRQGEWMQMSASVRAKLGISGLSANRERKLYIGDNVLNADYSPRGRHFNI